MSDFCTASPDSPFGYDISGCCALHDQRYEEQTTTRLEADLELKW